jgi:glycosyltransferase involved in cell wall biosynthesis
MRTVKTKVSAEMTSKGDSGSEPLDPPFLTVVIPAYNEAAGIGGAFELLIQELDKLRCSFEIVVVDDGSTDRTVETVRDWMQKERRIRLEQHPHNMGIGAGIKTGVKAARGRFMIFIPADLAMKPEQIDRYIEASGRADIVLGNRSDRRDYTPLRRLVSVVNIFVLRTFFRLEQHQFAYINLYRTSVLKQIRIESRGVFISHELIIKARDLGATLGEVHIDYLPRETGQAKGARMSRVIQAVWETWVFWIKWVYRTITHQRSKGYLTPG